MSSWTKSAKWIWTPKYREEDNRTGRYFLFRKSFQWAIPTTISEFPVHVSADSRYRLYVNGQRASFGPCKSYAEKWHYETVDILPYLKDGENVISARVLRYSPIEPGSSSIVRTELPGLMVRGEVEVILQFQITNMFELSMLIEIVSGTLRINRRDMEMC
jgi:hypothetical protein